MIQQFGCCGLRHQFFNQPNEALSRQIIYLGDTSNDVEVWGRWPALVPGSDDLAEFISRFPDRMLSNRSLLAMMRNTAVMKAQNPSDGAVANDSLIPSLKRPRLG